MKKLCRVLPPALMAAIPVGKHYMLFLRIRADIFQEGRFARTCFARQEYGLTGILNEVQGILKLFVLCIGNEAQKISDL